MDTVTRGREAAPPRRAARVPATFDDRSPATRIGIVAPPWMSIPTNGYGGTEQVVEHLSLGLARRGYEVTLVAAPGSHLPGVRVEAPLAELPPVMGSVRHARRHAAAAAAALAGCDIVVDHSPAPDALHQLAELSVPVLHVIHGAPNPEHLAGYLRLAAVMPDIEFIAVSNDQRRQWAPLRFGAVCHNGLDPRGMPFSDRMGEHLLFLGRLGEEKGAARAIDIAEAADLPILLAAKCREPGELDYLEREIEPRLGEHVTWLGEVDRDRKADLLGTARALVFPIAWPEPFGLVLIEAMAAGTPVLATPLGAVPEVVVDGVTGFVRDTPLELAAAAARLPSIDRRACRLQAERFSADAMVSAYERVLVAALERSTSDRAAAAG